MTPDPDRIPHRDTSGWPAELFTLPNHPDLFVVDAPHETSGLLRAQRAGFSGAKLASVFRLFGTSLMAKLQTALDQEGRASETRLPIHDEGIDKKTAAEYLKEAEAA